MAAPSSAQTKPSQIATIAPSSHPSMACGPPMLASMSGMVRNGPTPTISSMFAEVASRRPRPRIRWELFSSAKAVMFRIAAMILVLLLLAASAHGQTDPARLNRATALAREHKWAEAEATLKGVEPPNAPGERIAFHRLRAAVASGSGHHREAAEEMRSALRWSPTNKDLLLATAVAERAAGEIDAAIQHFRAVPEYTSRLDDACRDIRITRRSPAGRKSLPACGGTGAERGAVPTQSRARIHAPRYVRCRDPYARADAFTSLASAACAGPVRGREEPGGGQSAAGCVGSRAGLVRSGRDPRRTATAADERARSGCGRPRVRLGGSCSAGSRRGALRRPRPPART